MALNFTCEISLYCFCKLWHLSEWLCLDELLIKMCMCSDQARQKFSNVLHVAGVLFEQQVANAFLHLSVLWEPVKMFVRQYGRTFKCLCVQWQTIIFTF